MSTPSSIAVNIEQMNKQTQLRTSF